VTVGWASCRELEERAVRGVDCPAGFWDFEAAFSGNGKAHATLMLIVARLDPLTDGHVGRYHVHFPP
jgi:hypothetical protein